MSLAVLVVPGPSVVYVTTRTLAQGRRAGFYSMLGLEVGALLHVVAAVIGLGALVASSDGALTALRCAGAAYLVVLGAQQLRSAVDAVTVQPDAGGGRPGLRLFRDGVVVDLLNPKTALFFVAFLPQFVRTDHGPASAQLLLLGLCFVVLALACDGTYVLVASRISRRLDRSAHVHRRISRIAGAVYVGLAGVALLG